MAPRNDLHSLSIEGLSVALCLLPDKRSTTYEELFESLKDAAMANDKEFNPKPIITHYASALLPIIESEFSTALNCGSMLYFSQSTDLKITDLELVNEYLQDTNIRDYCRQLMALSLVPMNEVANQFQRLPTMMPNNLAGLLSYFQHQWMFSVFSLPMWNFYEGIHRINNT